MFWLRNKKCNFLITHSYLKAETQLFSLKAKQIDIFLYKQYNSNTDRLYIATAWTGGKTFGRQLFFHDVIYHKQPCNDDKRWRRVIFTTNGCSKHT